MSVDTIRFYEKKGLLNAEWIERQSNHYRENSEDCLGRLTLIRQAKRLGFTLTEIQKWIQDFESDRLTPQQKRQGREKQFKVPTRERDSSVPLHWWVRLWPQT